MKTLFKKVIVAVILATDLFMGTMAFQPVSAEDSASVTITVVTDSGDHQSVELTDPDQVKAVSEGRDPAGFVSILTGTEKGNYRRVVSDTPCPADRTCYITVDGRLVQLTSSQKDDFNKGKDPSPDLYVRVANTGNFTKSPTASNDLTGLFSTSSGSDLNHLNDKQMEKLRSMNNGDPFTVGGLTGTVKLSPDGKITLANDNGNGTVTYATSGDISSRTNANGDKIDDPALKDGDTLNKTLDAWVGSGKITTIVTEKIPGGNCVPVEGAGSGVTQRKYRCEIESGFGSVMNMFGGLIKYATFITALLGILMVVYSGIQYATSAGDTKGQTAAVGRITKLIGGLVLLFLVAFILNSIAPWIYS